MTLVNKKKRLWPYCSYCVQGSRSVQTEIINKVLSVEDRAQKIIRDSERSARDIVTEAQAKANEMVRSSLKAERERHTAVIARAQDDLAIMQPQRLQRRFGGGGHPFMFGSTVFGTGD